MFAGHIPVALYILHYFFISPPILKASPFLFMAESCSLLIGMDTPHFVNILCKVDEHLGWLHPLATVNSAARTSTCLDTHFRFPGCIPRGRFVGSFSKFVLSFVRDSRTVCDSNGTTLHPHQRRPRVPIAPHRCQSLSFSLVIVAIVAILVPLEW